MKGVLLKDLYIAKSNILVTVVSLDRKSVV